MPTRLPDFNDLGTLPEAKPNRGFANYNPPDATQAADIYARGIHNLTSGIASAASDIGSIAASEKTKDQNLESDMAHSSWLVAQTNLNEKLKNETDQEKLKTYGQDNYQTAANTAAGYFNDPKAKQGFLLRVAPDIAAAQVNANTRIFEIQKGEAKGNILDLGQSLKDNAIRAPDDATMAGFVQQYNDLVQSGVDKRYFTPEEGARDRQVWIKDTVKGHFEHLPPEDQVASLTLPKNPEEQAKGKALLDRAIAVGFSPMQASAIANANPAAAEEFLRTGHAPGESIPGAAPDLESVRANNPGNIHMSDFARAHGATSISTTPGGEGIAVFPTVHAGIQAVDALASERYQGGRRTPAELVAGMWTPGPNGKEAARNVAATMGIGVNSDMHLEKPENLQKFRDAIILQENGHEGALHFRAQASGLGSTGQFQFRANNAHVSPQWGNPDAPGFNQQYLTQINVPGTSNTIAVHKNSAPAFEGLLTELRNDGYPLQDVQSFNNRDIRGGTQKSQHAWGNAIDINPDKQPLGSQGSDFAKYNIDIHSLAGKYGLIWGGDFIRRKDPMHFENANPASSESSGVRQRLMAATDAHSAAEAALGIDQPPGFQGGLGTIPNGYQRVHDTQQTYSNFAGDPNSLPRASSPLLRFIPEDERQDLLVKANKDWAAQERGSALLRKEETTAIEAAKKDDETSIKETGIPVAALTPERAAASLGDEAGKALNRERALHSDYHAKTKDFERLTNEQINANVDSLKPTGGPSAKTQEANYNEAVEKANKLKKRRSDDPAESVSGFDAVKRAMAQYDPARPATFQRVVNARVAAQKQIGIAADPLTNAERDYYTREIAPVTSTFTPEGDKQTIANRVMAEFEAKYGSYTRAAVNDIVAKQGWTIGNAALIDAIDKKEIDIRHNSPPPGVDQKGWSDVLSTPPVLSTGPLPAVLWGQALTRLAANPTAKAKDDFTDKTHIDAGGVLERLKVEAPAPPATKAAPPKPARDMTHMPIAGAIRRVLKGVPFEGNP